MEINRFAGIVACAASAAFGGVFHVAPGGSDASGDGSASKPWATIGYAMNQQALSAGDTLVAADGVYNGRIYITRSFGDWVTIRAQNAYRAKVTNIQNGQAGEAFGIYTPGTAKICVEGFVFSNGTPSYTCPNGRETNFLVHFQDACDIVFQNNILFGNNAPGACNELLKINRGDTIYYPRDIQVRGNVFYDRPSAGGTDMIDAVRPGELDIYENIFFERSAPLAQSFMTLKTEVEEASMPSAYAPARNPRIKVYKNVFLNWDGAADQAFVQFGEDDLPQYMITNSLIENNLMIGNSAHTLAAPIQLKGCKNITVRANTIVGDLPGGSYGLRVGTEGANPRASGFSIVNNIWDDPTGTMTNRFVDTYGDVDTASITLSNNLYWNNGNALPSTGSVLPSMDAKKVVADPLLQKNQAGIVLPVWNDSGGCFASGNTTIRQEFERLVHACGDLNAQSPAIGAADPANMPPDDILGTARDAHPDIGAVEYVAAGVRGRGPRASDGPGHLFDFKIVPQPGGMAMLGIVAAHDATVSVCLYDMCGGRCLEMKDVAVHAGGNSMRCRLTRAGAYLAEVNWKGEKNVWKVFFLK